MENILNYVKGVGSYTFDKLVLTPLDFLALTEIAYLPYDDILKSGECLTIAELAQIYIKENGFSGEILSVITKPRIELLSLMGATERYKHIHANHFINDISPETSKQFSAITYNLFFGHLVVFRGTDENLTGWKEDFQMTYMNEVPAQVAAYDYLQECLDRVSGKIWVAGHSKGGNMAIFASSKIRPEDRDRIQSILAFDAPGLHDSILSSEGFLAIKEKIISYVPQDSVVSVLLGEPVNSQVVKSKGFLLLQHDTFTWEVSYLDFVKADGQSALSTHTDKTISELLGRMTLEDKKDFTDLIFTLFSDADIYKFGDITTNTPQKLIQILNSMANLSTEQRKLASRVIGEFFGTQADIFKTYLPKPMQTTGGKVKGIFRKIFKRKAKELPFNPQEAQEK